MIWGSNFSKVVTLLGEVSSGEDGEFVMVVPQKDAEGKKGCGGGHSDDAGHLGTVT